MTPYKFRITVCGKAEVMMLRVHPAGSLTEARGVWHYLFGSPDRMNPRERRKSDRVMTRGAADRALLQGAKAGRLARCRLAL
jgi:hypothetical protein